MISNRIYEMGSMLGLEHKDLSVLVAGTSILDEPDKLEVSLSPTDTYKGDGLWYGTISIKDFK